MFEHSQEHGSIQLSVVVTQLTVLLTEYQLPEIPAFGVCAAQPAPSFHFVYWDISVGFHLHTPSATDVLARLPARLKISSSVCGKAPDISYIARAEVFQTSWWLRYV